MVSLISFCFLPLHYKAEHYPKAANSIFCTLLLLTCFLPSRAPAGRREVAAGTQRHRTLQHRCCRLGMDGAWRAVQKGTRQSSPIAAGHLRWSSTTRKNPPISNSPLSIFVTLLPIMPFQTRFGVEGRNVFVNLSSRFEGLTV